MLYMYMYMYVYVIPTNFLVVIIYSTMVYPS